MAKLKNRQMQIPFGFQFYQPEIGWRPRRGSSFDTIVRELINARLANPAKRQALGWAVDYNTVADEVDAYNVAICKKMNWLDYIEGDSGGSPAVPFPQSPSSPAPSLFARAGRLAAGVGSLVDWIRSGAEAVPSELANARANVCANMPPVIDPNNPKKKVKPGCPLNAKGDLTSFFTIPVSEAIRAELGRRKEWNLSTPHDEKLGQCDACSCPLKLMVHVPLETKLKHMPAEAYQALHPACWIRKEKGNA